jgi:hypothetical protein
LDVASLFDLISLFLDWLLKLYFDLISLFLDWMLKLSFDLISLFRPNLVDNHIALLLSAWISAGLLEVGGFYFARSLYFSSLCIETVKFLLKLLLKSKLIGCTA